MCDFLSVCACACACVSVCTYARIFIHANACRRQLLQQALVYRIIVRKACKGVDEAAPTSQRAIASAHVCMRLERHFPLRICVNDAFEPCWGNGRCDELRSRRWLPDPARCYRKMCQGTNFFSGKGRPRQQVDYGLVLGGALETDICRDQISNLMLGQGALWVDSGIT